MATSSASGNGPPSAAGKRSDAGKFVEYDRFIDSTLRKTRQQVRNVDIAGGLMLLAAGTLAFFLLVALVDHWVLPGGLGLATRWGALAIYLAGAAVYCCRTLLPLLVRRINPVYAAHSIECSKPSLKNSLINFLLLRANPAGLTQNVYEAIEEQAATNLAKVPAEAAIDRSKLIRIGYLFLAVLLVSAIYKVVSPKDPLRTVGRVVLPWADIDPPTRVRILALEPGDKTVFRGQPVPVKAEVQGLPGDEPVTLYYTTADGQLVGRAIPMRLPADGYLYECQLPDGKEGIQQDVTYHVVAGDAVSHTYHLQVQAAPTIVVESVDYHYPDYTGLVSQTTDHQPDVKGIEGTLVTIHAVANQPIKQALIDFDCNGSEDQQMTFVDRQASVTFALALKDDRKTPVHSSYQLTFTNTDSQDSVQPIRHQIEVTPDVAPEIQFLAPKKDDVEVPLNAALACEITAGDPDYALSGVTLVGTLGGRPLVKQVLLDEIRPGQFGSKPRLSPKKLGLKAGDVLEYWAWAEDNKSPQPNHTETPHRRIKVVSPGSVPPNQDELAANDDDKPKPQDRNRRPQDQQPPQDPQAQDDPQQQDPQKQNPQNDKPQPGNPDQQDQPGKQGAQGGDSKSGEGQQKNGGQDKGGDKQGQTKPDNGQGAGEQGGGEQGGDKQGGDKQGGGKQDAGGQGDQPGKPKPDGAGQGQPNGDKQDGQGAGQGQKQESGGPVAKDGSQDGEAFEKILDRQREQQPKNKLKPQDDQQHGGKPSGNDQNKQIQGNQSGGEKPQPAGGGDKPADPSNEKGPQSKKNEAGKGGKDSGEKAQGEAKGTPAGTKPGGSASGEQNDQPGAPTGEPDDTPGAKPELGQPQEGQGGDRSDQKGDPFNGKPDPSAGQGQAKAGDRPKDQPKSDPGQSNEDAGEPTQEGAQGGGKSGKGAQAKGSLPQKNKAQPADGQQPDTNGGEGDNDTAQSGAGQRNGDDKQGSTTPQSANAPRNKTPSADKNPQKRPGGEPSSPSISPHQSDSKGDQSGDRSGGGGEGGGQEGSQAGTGGEGKNTPSDEGGGAANERGDGDTSDRPGQDREAAGRTGKSGDKPGKGSSTRKAEKKPGQPGGKPDQAGGEGDKRPEQPSDPADSKQPGTPGGESRGVPQGTGHTDSTEAVPPPAVPDRADDPNLEFTRKATELAIQRLRDQLNKGNVDQKLLDELGWEKEDLDRWVRGYEAMYRNANARGEQGKAAKAELDATLRSLGIHPKGTQIKNHLGDDQAHGMKEGRRSRPPAEYLEQYRAYTQGTSRVRPQSAPDKSDR